MATHSSKPVDREPGGLLSMGSQRRTQLEKLSSSSRVSMCLIFMCIISVFLLFPFCFTLPFKFKSLLNRNHNLISFDLSS